MSISTRTDELLSQGYDLGSAISQAVTEAHRSERPVTYRETQVAPSVFAIVPAQRQES